jgi:photosystem II stability/assembly factor-like uncharacterized protein
MTRWMFYLAAYIWALSLAVAPAAAAPGRWSPIGPEGAWVNSLAVVDGPPGRVLAATDRAGVFRSDDAGRSWLPSSSGLTDTRVADVETDPADATTAYAATMAGLFKSADSGQTWSRTGLPGIIKAVGIAPSAHQRIYSASAVPEDGELHVWRSDDGASSWQQIDTGLRRSSVLVALQVDPEDADRAYLVLDWVLYRTDDGGLHWSDESASLPSLDILAFALDRQDPRILYLAADTPTTGFFRSTDRGATWSRLGVALPTDFPQLLAVAPSVSGTVYAGVERLSNADTASTFLLFKSIDGGATWSAEQVPEPMRQVVIDPRRPQRVYAAGLTGVLRRQPGSATWVSSKSGLRAAFAGALAVDRRVPATLYAAARIGTDVQFDLGLQKSTDGGATWTPALPANSFSGLPIHDIAVDPVHTSTVYAVSAGIFKSLDRGATWSSLPLDALIPTLNDLAIDPRLPQVLRAVGYLIPCGGLGCPDPTASPRALESLDGGASWSDFTPRLLPPGTHGVFNVAAIDPVHPRFIYIAGDQTFKSGDHGATWAQLPVGSRVVDLALDPAAPRTLYAVSGADGKVLKSADGGASWTAATAGLPAAGLKTECLAVDPATATVYLGTNLGVFVSRDRAVSWRPLNRGLTDLSVLTLAVDPTRPGTVYAGFGAGLFAYTSR